jgi:hypothetical protein
MYPKTSAGTTRPIAASDSFVAQTRGYVICCMFLWRGKTHCTLIATPNVDNANIRQKKGKS